MELVCVGFFLALGNEKVDLIIDHFTRFAQAIPYKNHTVHTASKVLYYKFFLQYNFPEN